MNNTRSLTMSEDSPEVLKGTLWAAITVAAVGGFFLLTWLGIQHEQAMRYKQNWQEAEAERDEVRRESDVAIRDLNVRLNQSEEARTKAKSQAEEALDAKAKAETERDEFQRELATVRGIPIEPPPSPNNSEPSIAQSSSSALSTGAVPPSTTDIANFIRNHLARMMGAVASQLGDYYADGVDFHDNPRASLQAIGADRERWAEKWPRRTILASEVSPEITINQDPYFGWQATAVFNWRWFFWSRSGAAVRGVYRDTWRIVPGAQGMKITSEHSVDAATGRSRD
jgi:hypothetical protein